VPLDHLDQPDEQRAANCGHLSAGRPFGIAVIDARRSRPRDCPNASIIERGRLCRTARSWQMKMNRLIPMLPVKNISLSIEFYQKLGFTVEQRRDDWGWAMLRFDDCRIMVDRSINQRSDAPRQSVVYLYPANVREFHEQLRASGLVVPELDVTFYGMSEFRVDDPDGNHLWIGQNLPEAT
jgi:uncharacterized glyoxalase superfamily protein PhnB